MSNLESWEKMSFGKAFFRNDVNEMDMKIASSASAIDNNGDFKIIRSFNTCFSCKDETLLRAYNIIRIHLK